MKTNELKKGDWVALRNGWMAQIMDNRRGNIRTAMVYGRCTEAGSVYSHDIMHKIVKPAPPERPLVVIVRATVEHTPAQLKLRKLVEAF